MSNLSNEDLLEGNSHITDAEIMQDIATTKAEINELQTKRAVSMSVSPRLQIGYSKLVRERKDFIADLERILKLRHATPSNKKEDV